MSTFIIINIKKYREYMWIVLVWLFFPVSISLLKQIEPRNVAPNLVALISASGFVIDYAIQFIRLKLFNKDNQGVKV